VTDFSEFLDLEPGVHPGVALRIELAGRGYTQTAFAKLIGRSPQVLSEIFHAKKGITPESALQFEATLGIPAAAWLYAQADYELHRARSRQ